MAQKGESNQVQDNGGAGSAAVRKYLAMVLILLNILGLGAGAYLTYISTMGYQPEILTEKDLWGEIEEKRDIASIKPIMYTMEPFMVNLKDEPRRIIRMELTLEMLTPAGFEEVVKLGAKARDRIVQNVSSKSFRDIETIQGKLFLKDEIATMINSRLENGVVKDVYFSEFIVQ